MELRLSQRVRRIKPSPTLAVSARAAALKAAGHNVLGSVDLFQTARCGKAT